MAPNIHVLETGKNSVDYIMWRPTVSQIAEIRVDPPSRVGEGCTHVADRSGKCRRRGDGIGSREEVPHDLCGGGELSGGVHGE